MKTSITSIAFIFMVLSVMIVQARMDRIDLKNVQTLTFTKDKMTEARRVPPISQVHAPFFFLIFMIDDDSSIDIVHADFYCYR